MVTVQYIHLIYEYRGSSSYDGDLFLQGLAIRHEWVNYAFTRHMYYYATVCAISVKIINNPK